LKWAKPEELSKSGSGTYEIEFFKPDRTTNFGKRLTAEFQFGDDYRAFNRKAVIFNRDVIAEGHSQLEAQERSAKRATTGIFILFGLGWLFSLAGKLLKLPIGASEGGD
jgi:hypothetical protein